MASNSITKICNRAIQKVGGARILDITDDSKAGRACNACYDSVRQSELRKHYWRFAIKRATLAPVAGFTSEDYAYAFQLPSDCLRIIKPRDPYLDWQLEGRRILTSQTNALALRYVGDITDPTLFDANFSEMLSMKVGEEICEELTQSNSKIAKLSDDYKRAFSEAKQMNAFETIPVEPEEDSWLIARR